MDLITLALAKNFTNEKVSEVDERIKKVEDLSPFIYKGSVPSYADLPANAKKGETYTIEDTGDEYVYSGNSWIKLGNNITTEDLNKKQDIIEDLEEIRTGAALGAAAIQQWGSI